MSTSLILATVVVADLALNAALLLGRLRNRAGEHASHGWAHAELGHAGTAY
jgi:hypothetical protein